MHCVFSSRTLIVVFSSLVIAMVLVTAPVIAGDVEVVGRDDPRRAQLLNAARPVFHRQTGGDIEFVVRRLAVLDGWAFGHVKLQRPGGKPIDWQQTQFAEAQNDGFFDPASSFFLMRRSARGWGVQAFAVGPTDVAWDGWRQELRLPMALFVD